MFGIRCSRLHCFPPTSSCWSYWILPILGAIVLGFLYRYYTAESKSSWGDRVEVGKHIHWECELETCLEAERCPLLESCWVCASPLEARWLARRPPQTWGQCPSFPRALLPKHLLIVLCPCQCPSLHWLPPAPSCFWTWFYNYNPNVLVTLSFGENACFPVPWCTSDVLNRATHWFWSFPFSIFLLTSFYYLS